MLYDYKHRNQDQMDIQIHISQLNYPHNQMSIFAGKYQWHYLRMMVHVLGRWIHIFLYQVMHIVHQNNQQQLHIYLYYCQQINHQCRNNCNALYIYQQIDLELAGNSLHKLQQYYQHTHTIFINNQFDIDESKIMQNIHLGKFFGRYYLQFIRNILQGIYPHNSKLYCQQRYLTCKNMCIFLYFCHDIGLSYNFIHIQM